MRRYAVLLSVLLATGALATQPAQAGPMCARAWTEGPTAPDVGTQQVCVLWEHGAYCESHHNWVDEHAHVYAEFCYPAPLG